MRRFFDGGLRQLLARLRVQVVTQFEEGIPRDDFTRLQSQPFAADANPLPGLRFALSVVIVVRKMLVEIGRRSRPILLWFAGEHTSEGYAKISDSSCSA